MKMIRIHELSHRVDPDREEYRLEVDSRQVEGWEQFAKYPRLPEAQYLISEVTLCTHIGTHVELPFHHDAGGLDAAEPQRSRGWRGRAHPASWQSDLRRNS